MGWAKAPLLGLLRASVLAAEHRDPAPGGPGWGRGPQPVACHHQWPHSGPSVRGQVSLRMQVLDQWEGAWPLHPSWEECALRLCGSEASPVAWRPPLPSAAPGTAAPPG